MIRKLELTPSNFLVQIFIACSSKGELATKHGEEKNARRPNVSRWSNILALKHDLWAHVTWRAAKDFESNIGRCATTKAEVD